MNTSVPHLRVVMSETACLAAALVLSAAPALALSALIGLS